MSNRSTASDIFAERLHAMTSAAVAPVADELRSHPSNPDEFITRFFNGGGERAAGVTVNETTAMSASAVFACVRNLAEDEAKLPFLTYEKLEPRGKKRRTDLPVYKLLHDEPNPEMTAFSFREAMTASAALYGGGLAEIERTNDGTPLALWPIEPWRWRAERVGPRGRELVYRIDGRDVLPARDVLHIKGFGINGLVGYMVAQVGRESLGLTLAAQRFAANYYANGTRVSGILTHPARLSPEGQKNLGTSFDKKYSGVENSHGTPVLEEGVTWTKVSADADEAQMLEARQFQVEDVARWLRMPPHKIGHLLRATGWSTLEATNTDYVIDTLMPWLVRWEQECNRKLIGAGNANLFCEHLVNGLMRGDSAARADFYQKMWNIGVYSQNDILEKENDNPVEGGDERYVPLNMVNARVAATANPLEKFQQEVVKAFIADGTVADVIANSTDIGDLVGKSGLPRNAEYKEPYLPVTADAGPLVSGAVIKDADGDVVGGDVLPPPSATTPVGSGGGAAVEPEPIAVGDQVKGNEEQPKDGAKNANEGRVAEFFDGGTQEKDLLLTRSMEALRPSMLDAAARVVRREVEVLRKKAKTADAVRKFFVDHADYVRTAFLPIAEAREGIRAAIQGDEPRPTEISIDLEPYVLELTAAVEAGTVGEVLDRWEKNKAEDIVRNRIWITDLSQR